MAGDPVITLVGNLTADPELRFTPNGAAVANFTVASTPRMFDRKSGEFRDGETLFMRCSLWRDAAENVAESLSRGTRVIVQGRLKSRTFETKEGERRTVMELDVDEIGPSLRFAKAQVSKVERSGGYQGGGQQGGYGGGQQSGGWGQPGGQQTGGGWGQQGGQQGSQGGFGGPQNDPWAASDPNQNQGGGGWGSPTESEPPF